MIPPPPGLITINLNVDLDKILSQSWDRFLRLFGKDVASEEMRAWLDGLTRLSFLQSKNVQCIGMHEPILISDIYQPTRLIREHPKSVKSLVDGREWEAPKPEIVSVGTFLAQKQSSVITAGPGWGKTTFLHWLFLRSLLHDDTVLPILITLRQKGSVDDLAKVITNISHIQTNRPEGQILLLVDGYDEVTAAERQTVSGLLSKFSVAHAGAYYLTCRDYYEIFDLKAPRIKIAEFTEQDQKHFAIAFLRAYNSPADGSQLVEDLHQRGFSDLIQHPLLLTLAALVRSGSSEIHARNTVSLIEAALSTLSLRWDQGKNLTRQPKTPLDGPFRLKLLKRLAYSFGLEPVQEHRAVNIVRKQLELTKWDSIEPLDVLSEIAQFYGIFVPIGDRWGFVHRSLQDFLAAQHWVETGEFADALKRNDLKFDSRTAYAGCLVEDGTRVMELALQRKDGLPVFVEMLRNDPSFRHDRIADAITDFYNQYKGEHYYYRTDEKIECAVDQEFIVEASSKFLDYVIQACAAIRGKTTDTLAAYAILELHRRRVSMSAAAYAACKNNYTGTKFVFDVRNRGNLRLADVRHK